MLHHPFLKGKKLSVNRCTMEKALIKDVSGVVCQARGAETVEAENSVDWWVWRCTQCWRSGVCIFVRSSDYMNKNRGAALLWLHCRFIMQCVFAYVCFLVWVTRSCTADLVCVIAVENTNLANTSKAVCHFGTALLGAPLTHWTSQHFSLFTVAHAKPPFHLKSLQHVVNSLPKGNLHFFLHLLRVRPVRNTKEENCHCIASGGTVSDTLCYLHNSIDRLLVVIISCLVCSESSTW